MLIILQNVWYSVNYVISNAGFVTKDVFWIFSYEYLIPFRWIERSWANDKHGVYEQF